VIMKLLTSGNRFPSRMTGGPCATRGLQFGDPTRTHSSISPFLRRRPRRRYSNLAGLHGVGLLSIGATTAAGFDALALHWTSWKRSLHYKTMVDRSKCAARCPRALR